MKKIIIVLISLCLFFSYFIYISYYDLDITIYEIQSEKINNDINIVMIGDVHDYHCHIKEEVINQINELNPDIILLDEAISALDVQNREIMKRELKEIQKKFKSTMIFITHEQEEAFYLADRVMIMSEGNIEQIDTPDNIYRNPKNQYIKDFVIAHLEQKYESLLKCTGRSKNEA